MLWFNYFILAWFKFYFLCFGVQQCMIISLKQREIKFKPRIKLNHNIYNQIHAKVSCLFGTLVVSRVHYYFCLNIPSQRLTLCNKKRRFSVAKLPWKGGLTAYFTRNNITHSAKGYCELSSHACSLHRHEMIFPFFEMSHWQ